jgi:hypothetical protein
MAAAGKWALPKAVGGGFLGVFLEFKILNFTISPLDF